MIRYCLVLLLAFVVVPAFGQKPDDVLATAKGHTWMLKDLSPEAQDAAAKFPLLMSSAKKQVLSQYIGELVLEAEAKARRISPVELVNLELKKIKDPTPAEIKAVYDANADKLGGKSLEDIRPQIVEFLRREPEERAVKSFVDSLVLKYKGTNVKDVSAPSLQPTDVLFSSTAGSITFKDFADHSRLTLFGIEADFFDDLKDDAAETVYNALVMDEAAALKVDSGELIAREVTSKMKDFSDQEKTALESAFRNKLFAKYNAKILVKVPDAPQQNISVDDDPSTGAATSPVTIVMFSDFQCSACSATHPLLKEAMAAYPGKIRFVVRDFPLETIHPNSFHAAMAANAAKAQGKFFEYVEILYKNQKAQDDASLKKYAADLGLNAQQFAIDFNSEQTAAEIRNDMADGRAYGITGTPSIFVNGRYVRKLSVDGFKEAIEAALGK